MLYGADGQALDLAPSPNPLTEERVNAELRQLDSLLFIAWMPVAYIAPNGRHEGRYALCYRWHNEDKRWTALPGTANEGPYDIIGWFCEDIHDARSVPRDPESMLAKVRELLAGADGTRMPWKDRMLRCIEKNNAIRKRPKEVISDLMEHVLRENMGAKASAVHKRSSDPAGFDYAGLQREVEQEMEVQFPDSGGHDAE